MKKRRFKDSPDDVYNDLMDAIIEDISNGSVTLSDAIQNAIDDRLDAESVEELAEKYLDGTELLDLFYDSLVDDLTSDIQLDFNTTQSVNLDNGDTIECNIEGDEMTDFDFNVSVTYDFDYTLEDNLETFKNEYQSYLDENKKKQVKYHLFFFY